MLAQADYKDILTMTPDLATLAFPVANEETLATVGKVVDGAICVASTVLTVAAFVGSVIAKK